MPLTSPPIFDGHNDLILRLLRGTATPEGVTAGLPDGHIDLPRAQAGGLGGGFFAIYVPSPMGAGLQAEEMSKPSYDMPLPAMIAQPEALKVTLEGAAALEAMQDAGALTICGTVAELETAIHGPKMAAIMHIEGAEAIDPDFEVLHRMHARGLRSLGPVWSRPTIFGHGVPFRFPSTGDIGPGLTDHGKRLVAECNKLNIMIDLSHLNEKGMDDVAAITDAPLVATHSNAYAVSPHARNLTDRQLEMIAQSDGMVGINFASAFLRPDGQMDSDFSLDVMMQHLDHLVKILGEDRVGFGSDFDGALVPRDIGSCAGLPALRAAMTDHGIGAETMEKLCYRNWLRVLRKTWSV
ncbi:membrane dipeptidase [Salipiger aestuarii]|uniref:Membrane dipeptidase n=1 Tax=Salipiger aestuarii TaxID=568098 RepID=A0A327YY39_9RHOB|nr:dipeptidase [Salipiger aestuarii]RAK22829.1 membrane dipeptidase [Salipiger aestuarii]